MIVVVAIGSSGSVYIDYPQMNCNLLNSCALDDLPGFTYLHYG